MKIDVRNINIWDTVYTANEWEVHKIEIKEFFDKVRLVAEPLCRLNYFDTEKEAKKIAKNQLEAKIENLDTNK